MQKKIPRICCICGKVIEGEPEQVKSRRGTTSYFHRSCMKKEQNVPAVYTMTLEEIDRRIVKSTVDAVIEIGYYLKQIRDRELYKEAGCADIYEYARKQYGYDKSVTSRHMSCNDRFSIGGNGPVLAEEYAGYGKSQLQEMVSMSDAQISQVKPDMTVREMKEIKKTKKTPEPEPEAEDEVKEGQASEVVATSQQADEKKLSAHGLPIREYPEGSLLGTVGCEGNEGIGFDCFDCYMDHCQIRQEECYCVEAPLGNPFPCQTLLFMEQGDIKQRMGSRCQFVEHSLAYHRAGDGSAVPCCKKCKELCEYRCDRSFAKIEKSQQEDNIIDGKFREVAEETENRKNQEEAGNQGKQDEENLTEGSEDQRDLKLRTDRELLEEELAKYHRWIKLLEDARADEGCAGDEFLEDDWIYRRHKLMVDALEAFIRNMNDGVTGDKPVLAQPPLPELKNNDQRKEWLRSYKDWGLWYEDIHTGAKYYKFDFENGARLVAEVYQEEGSKYIPEYESCHLHLIGGPEPPKGANGIGKWNRHEKYSRYPSNETELVEFLKEIQKSG